MVKRIALFQTNDGQTFVTEKEAVEHEARSVIEVGVNDLMTKLKLGTATIDNPESEEIVFLSAWLVGNRTELLAALSGAGQKKARTPKAERTPRVKKEKPAGQPAATVMEAIAPAVEEKTTVAVDNATAELDALVQEVEHHETVAATEPDITMSETDALLAMLTDEAK